jgi:hypothetical protein
MSHASLLFLCALLAPLFLSSAEASLKAGDCEVCISVMTKFAATLSKEELTKPKKIEDAFRVFCEPLKLKENRFVSFLFE